MLKIYLADLVYDTIKTNFAIPLNIGFIAAYAKEKFGDQIEIKLFKYPTELEKAMRASPPDVLGVSHYSWNARLSLAFLDIAREINPKVITVMGGPNIRTEPEDLSAFLGAHKKLDYYVVHEGEEAFSELIGELLEKPGELPLAVPGFARFVEGTLHYKSVEFSSKPREMKQPSPYLTGILDDFIKDPNMIPLFETNRGCPFGCTYCAWGVAALSKVRQRPVEDVFAEIDYVAQYSAGQTEWIFCDANFGMLQRDIEIANRIRKVMDEKGFPKLITLWHSKNTSQRNIEIVKTIGGMSEGYVAIQSTDPEVLTNAGRGTMKLTEFKKVIDHYKANKLPVTTDILVGLPGESAASHLRTLVEAFDLGFDTIEIYNIRMLPGTKYESAAWREKFGVQTKYRPIYGSYGIYGGRRIFELEESVRATSAMTEKELNGFKVLHALIGFAWNSGFFKPVLRYGQSFGVSPGWVLHRLTQSKNPLLSRLFKQMEEDSLNEWFDDPEKMIAHYEKPENYDHMVKNFMKLYMLYLARIFQDPEIISAMNREVCSILREELRAKDVNDFTILDSLSEIVQRSMCKDLLQDEMSTEVKYPGRVAAALFNKPEYSDEDTVLLEIFRSKETASLCREYFHTDLERERGLSLHALVRFIESGGIRAFVNSVRPLEPV